MENEVKDKKQNTEISGLAIAGLVLGIIGVLGSFIPIVNNATFVLTLIGLILSIIGLTKSSKKAMAIAAIILSVVAMVTTLGLQAKWSNDLNNVSKKVNKSLDNYSGKSTDKILKNYLAVELGQLQVSTDEYGITNTKLTVSVTNKAKVKKSYELIIEAVDASGNRVMEDYVYANDLAPNQNASYDIFSYIAESKLEAMKAATIKISSVKMY